MRGSEPSLRVRIVMGLAYVGCGISRSLQDLEEGLVCSGQLPIVSPYAIVVRVEAIYE
jgi:hypothetical protein